MKKIVIVGGGIIGTTLANYLDPAKYQVLLIDDATGQATKASAGIISPWLSKRRNKQWYQLAKDGAAFLTQLVAERQLPESIYARCGTLLLREESALEELALLAKERRETAPEIGTISLLTGTQTHQRLPLINPVPSLAISGGARLDGKAYLTFMQSNAQHRGVKLLKERVTHIEKKHQTWLLKTTSEDISCDILCLCPGSSLKELMAMLGYQVDIRPQKGQLLVFDTALPTEQWPVAMLDGEGDLIPFPNGKILLGATHENEAGWDLQPTMSAANQLMTAAEPFLANSAKLFTAPQHLRVGTRAYTSDFAPFFGPLEADDSLLIASGLGSSGLTTGPYIGYLLARYLDHDVWETDLYQKPLSRYVKNDGADSQD